MWVLINLRLQLATATDSRTNASLTRTCTSELATEVAARIVQRTGTELTVSGARRTSSKALETSAYLAIVILLVSGNLRNF